MAVAPGVGGQQLQLAPQAVAEAHHPGCRTTPDIGAPQAKLAPGRIGLGLMVESGHVAPGGNLPTLGGQGFEQAPITQLGLGGQVAAADEFDHPQRLGGVGGWLGLQ